MIQVLSRNIVTGEFFPVEYLEENDTARWVRYFNRASAFRGNPYRLYIIS